MKIERFISLLSATLVVVALTTFGASPTLAETFSRADPASITDALRNAPVMFIENVGQWNNAARFQVRGDNATIFFAEDAIWLTVAERATPSRGMNLKLSFAGANPHPTIEPLHRLATRVTYLIGDDNQKWQSDVPAWSGIIYRQVYPGIDLEFTGENGRIVPRVIARAGADTSRVQLRVDGADQLIIANDALRLVTSQGEYTLPWFQIANHFGARPEIVGNVINAPFAESPSNQPAFAPSGATDLLYSTFLGGGGEDYGRSIAVDGSGAAYVTGYTASANFPTTAGAFDTTSNGQSDVFVVKLNASGSALTYATFLGGSGNDLGYGIAIDSSGAAYVTGYTASSNFPTTGGAFDTSSNGLNDGFVAKLDASGAALTYATYLGGMSNDEGWSIVVDSSGAAYIAGVTYSTNFPVTLSAFSTTCGGCSASSDSFVAKLNASGSALTYATFFGGTSGDFAYSIAIDAGSAAYITGYTTSSDLPTTASAFDTMYNSLLDGYVMKLNASGSALSYATYLGGGGNDSGYSIAVDTSGAAYVTGWTESFDFPTTPGVFSIFNGGAGDVFITKLNASGSALTYSTFFGGSNFDRANGITIDTAGVAYITGQTGSADLPITVGAYDSTFNSGFGDAFVTMVNASGSALIYSTFIGGGGNDSGYAIALDSNRAVFIAGFTTSAGFPTTIGAFDPSFNAGTTDAFVSKLAITAAILGRVTDGSNNPISGATLSLSSGASTATDASGYYTFTGIITGTYTITPTKSGYTFSPTSRNVSVPPNATNQDFMGALATYSITGRVADGNNNAIAGVTISDGLGHTTTTDVNGNYTLSESAPGVYTITPSKSGYTFAPTSRNVNVPPNVANQDFVGTLITYSISGRVADGSNNAISGVTISDGQGHSTTTDVNGNYTLSGLVSGAYTITPTKSGYTFSPTSRNVSVPPNAANQDFVATPQGSFWLFCPIIFRNP